MIEILETCASVMAIALTVYGVFRIVVAMLVILTAGEE